MRANQIQDPLPMRTQPDFVPQAKPQNQNNLGEKRTEVLAVCYIFICDL